MVFQVLAGTFCGYLPPRFPFDPVLFKGVVSLLDASDSAVHWVRVRTGCIWVLDVLSRGLRTRASELCKFFEVHVADTPLHRLEWCKHINRLMWSDHHV
jgi:hypothetical protein